MLCDIKNIEDLDENIVINEVINENIQVKLSRIVNEEVVKPIEDIDLQNEIDSLLTPYKDKSAEELEEESGKTEPLLETENIGEKIDLDGYAWYYNKINSDEFWEEVIKKDEYNKNHNVYGKFIIRENSKLDSQFS